MSKELNDKRKGYKRYSKHRRIKSFSFYFTKIKENRTKVIIGISLGLIIACVGLIYSIDYEIDYFYETTKTISDDMDTYVYNEYRFPEEHVEEITPNQTEITETNTFDTEHYKGVESFYNNTIGETPTDWLTIIEGNSEVSEFDPDGIRQKINKVWAVYFGSRSITEHQLGAIYNYGIIEFWWRLGPTQPLLQIGTPWSRIKFMKAGTVVFQIMQYNRWFGFNNATGDSVGENTHGGNTVRLNWYQWYRIKIEFRLGGASAFRNLMTNRYNLYVDDDLLEGNATCINLRTGISYWERWINTGLEQYDAWGELLEDIVPVKELDGSNYTESDNKETWDGTEKTINYTFTIDRNYQYIKNFTYSFNFDTNITLFPDFDAWIGIYNFVDDVFEMKNNSLITDFYISEEKYFPSMWYLNNDYTNTTYINIYATVNTVHSDYTSVFTSSVLAYFFRVI